MWLKNHYKYKSTTGIKLVMMVTPYFFKKKAFVGSEDL